MRAPTKQQYNNANQPRYEAALGKGQMYGKKKKKKKKKPATAPSSSSPKRATTVGDELTEPMLSNGDLDEYRVCVCVFLTGWLAR